MVIHHQHWPAMFVLVFIEFARASVLVEYATIGMVSENCQVIKLFFRGDDGLAAGLAGHFLVFDQFEFNIYYGPDYLFSDGSSQMNLSFDLRKKW